MKIVDAHQHLWNLEQFSYSWCQGIPALNRSFPLEDYLAASAGLDVARTVFVECDVDDPRQLDEARHIQQLARENPLIAGIVASCRPEYEDFPRHLDRLQELPLVKGVRRVLHAVPDEVSQTPLFIKNLRRLADDALTFDLCVLARQLPLALALVEECPKVSFILDHCGVPDVKGRTFDPWRGHIAELARHPNVACKVSGLVAYADPGTWTEADLQPWLAHVVEHFGWKRLLWGSDWPVCTLAASFRKWLQTAQSLASGATPEERDNFFWRNAERIYRLN